MNAEERYRNAMLLTLAASILNWDYDIAPNPKVRDTILQEAAEKGYEVNAQRFEVALLFVGKIKSAGGVEFIR